MPPDTNLLKGVSRENLSRALKLKRGKKLLVIDSKLTQVLDLIANFAFLQDHGVEKIVHLGSKAPAVLPDSTPHILYFIRAELQSAKLVCDQIAGYVAGGNSSSSVDFGVVLMPRLLHVIVSLFESEGILEHVTFGQYSHEMIPLEDNLLTLAMPHLFPQLWLAKDTANLAAVAKAIFNLRGIYGDFHHVVALGPYSQSVMRMQQEFEKVYANNLKAHNRCESDIPTLIVMDRSLDYLSPLLISLSYESVLDEMFGIRGRSVVFPPEVTGGKENLKHNLASDAIFQKIRHLHFSKVVGALLAKEKELRRLQDESVGLNLQDMKNFVSKDLHRIQSLKKMLALHFGAFEWIIQQHGGGVIDLKRWVDVQENILDGSLAGKELAGFFEDAIARGLDKTNVLRLICTASLVQDGLREVKSLKNQFVQSYGFRHCLSLDNLESLGILSGGKKGVEASARGVANVVVAKVASSTPFAYAERKNSPATPSFQPTLKKLVPPSSMQLDLSTLSDPSYVFNGRLAPLVTKVTSDILSTIVTPKMNATLLDRKLEECLKGYNIAELSVKCSSGAEAYGRGRTVLVFLIGGISRGEVASLQVVARDLGFNIVCGGTDVTTGATLLHSSIA